MLRRNSEFLHMWHSFWEKQTQLNLCLPLSLSLAHSLARHGQSPASHTSPHDHPRSDGNKRMQICWVTRALFNFASKGNETGRLWHALAFTITRMWFRLTSRAFTVPSVPINGLGEQVYQRGGAPVPHRAPPLPLEVGGQSTLFISSHWCFYQCRKALPLALRL